MEIQRTILVVEDDSDIASIIRYILEGEGYRVLMSEPAALWKDIENFRPGLIILDHRLRGVLGSNICKELKADPKTSYIPIILTSATNNIHDIAEDCLPDDILPKPFDIDVLVAKVNGFILPEDGISAKASGAA